MPTKLNTSVKRELSATNATKKGRICKAADAGSRPVIIELGTDEMIRFRVKGTRKNYEIHAIVAFQIAQINQLQADYKARMEEYQLKRKAGYKRIRKPKKPFYPSILFR